VSVSTDFVEEQQIDDKVEDESSIGGIDSNLNVDAVEETPTFDPNKLIPTFSDTIICYPIISGLIYN